MSGGCRGECQVDRRGEYQVDRRSECQVDRRGECQVDVGVNVRWIGGVGIWGGNVDGESVRLIIKGF